MRVWRLCHQRFAATAFDGEGARLYGGRWNHKGLPLVYCSATLSLAVLETLVHHRVTIPPPDFVAIPAELPAPIKSKTLIKILTPADLPADWRENPPPASLQQIGSDWLQSAATVALAVPSAIVPGECNYLLNPRHRDFARLAIGAPQPFPFDPRLWP
ncbi:MAG: RES family NAD+ phosphorylase [Blastocatellia bacterium]